MYILHIGVLCTSHVLCISRRYLCPLLIMGDHPDMCMFLYTIQNSFLHYKALSVNHYWRERRRNSNNTIILNNVINLKRLEIKLLSFIQVFLYFPSSPMSRMKLKNHIQVPKRFILLCLPLSYEYCPAA